MFIILEKVNIIKEINLCQKGQKTEVYWFKIHHNDLKIKMILQMGMGMDQIVVQIYHLKIKNKNKSLRIFHGIKFQKLKDYKK